MKTLLAAVALLLLITSTAAAAPETAAPAGDEAAPSEALQGLDWQAQLLAYAPTGDALYDELQKALLVELAKPPQPGLTLMDRVALSDEQLAAWEERYSSDPRYWQLRMFELTHDAADDETQQTAIANVEALWQQHTPADPVLLWLQYLRQVELLKDAPAAQQQASREALLQALRTNCPQESEPCYELALLYFEKRDWDKATQALESGNTAASNRNLTLFPESFLKQQLRADAPIGNEAAAGALLHDCFGGTFGYGRGTQLRDIAKEFAVRGNVGAGGQAAAALSRFACRMAQMDGAGVMDAMLASTLARNVLSHLMTNEPEKYSVEQREALLRLYDNWGSIRKQTSELVINVPDEDEQIDAALSERGITAIDVADFVLHGDPQVDLAWRLKNVEAFNATHANFKGSRQEVVHLMDGLPTAALDLNLRSLHFAFSVTQGRHNLSPSENILQNTLSRIAGFDWESIAWPPEKK